MSRYRLPVDRTLPVSVQPAIEFGPDPVGATLADNVQGIWGADLAGLAGQPGMVKIATAGLGNPAANFNGDLGPLQGRGGPIRLRTAAGRGTARWGNPAAFPSTNGPLSIQDIMGNLGI